MSWPLEQISAVAGVNPTLAEKPSSTTVVSFVPMAAVCQDTLKIEAHAERPFSEVAKGYTPFRRGDVLVAKITPCFENGKMALAADLPHELGFGTTEFHVFRPSERVSGSYLFHMLRAPYVRAAGTIKMTGAAGQRRVPAAFFSSLRIPVPPLAEQKRIARTLDTADELRAKRREALAELDSLQRAVFLDMFGDPIANPKGFPVATLTDFYVNKKGGTKCGPFGSALKKEELVGSGVPVWNMDNIEPSGRMVLPFRMWITPQKFKQLQAYAVLDGDVLISRAGTVGKMCVAAAGVAASIISTNLIRVRFGPSLLPGYFVALMTYCKGRVGRLKTGPDGGFTHMSTGVLDKLTFPYPPVDLQRRFVACVEAIEEQKALHRAHLAELDTLFASLQSRAFRGEL